MYNLEKAKTCLNGKTTENTEVKSGRDLAYKKINCKGYSKAFWRGRHLFLKQEQQIKAPFRGKIKKIKVFCYGTKHGRSTNKPIKQSCNKLKNKHGLSNNE
jgi:hypothetical protein